MNYNEKQIREALAAAAHAETADKLSVIVRPDEVIAELQKPIETFSEEQVVHDNDDETYYRVTSAMAIMDKDRYNVRSLTLEEAGPTKFRLVADVDRELNEYKEAIDHLKQQMKIQALNARLNSDPEECR